MHQPITDVGGAGKFINREQPQANGVTGFNKKM
jgi:hypothetical protein